MKLDKIALAIFATVATAATAGVTVTPLVGYTYTDEAHDKQRNVFRTGTNVSPTYTNAPRDGVSLESDLYAGLALGVEITPTTQFQIEYGMTDTESEETVAGTNTKFDAKEENITGNFLLGLTRYNEASRFKPYLLIGGGQQKTSIENQAGNEVAESKDTIGNAGLGARFLINDALALRGEVRGVHNFDHELWEGQALAGLEVTLGGRAKPAMAVAPVEPPPVVAVVVEKDEPVVDSDGDGVPDHLDACPGTAPNTVVDSRGCPETVVISDDLRMELRVFFDYDKSNIKPQYREEVAKVADKMREYPNATAAIEGHASKDSKRSNARYNQRLSEARANAVKSMLSNEFGIAPNRLSAVGYGFDRPIAPNDTAEGKAMNRRVYAVIEGSKTETVERTTDMQ